MPCNENHFSSYFISKIDGVIFYIQKVAKDLGFLEIQNRFLSMDSFVTFLIEDMNAHENNVLNKQYHVIISQVLVNLILVQ